MTFSILWISNFASKNPDLFFPFWHTASQHFIIGPINGHFEGQTMLFEDIPDSPRASQRMSRTAYDGAACRAALRGELVPSKLGNHVARLALVSGIRHHVNFARSHEVGEITVLPGQELFTHARNARRIMSNSVPPAEAMSNKACYPYCIWYPDVATENTYRDLAIRYPDLRYQIGRACAVAGYYNCTAHWTSFRTCPLLRMHGRTGATPVPK